MSIRWMILAVLPFLLSGCLTTRAQLRTAQRDQSDVQLSPAQQTKAEAVVQAQVHDDQLRQMNGRIEVLENLMNQVQAGEGKQAQAVTKEIEDLKLRLKLFEEALYKFEQNLAGVRQEVADLKAMPKSSPVSATASKPTKDKADAYEMGEAAFKKKDWRQAILDYQRYREKYPKGKNYADATLKIGIAFSELRMKDEAKSFFDEVIAKFPKTSSAKAATKHLQSLK